MAMAPMIAPAPVTVHTRMPTPPTPLSSPSPSPSPRPAILRQAASISAAVIPFGVAFGVASSQADLHLVEAIGFSTLVFSGGAQFAAVSVLSDEGTVAAAVVSGMLLNLRLLAFGLVMAPALTGPRWWRAAVAQFMIDETTAVGAGQPDLRWRRYGYLVTGGMLFVVWNASTVLGAAVLGDANDLIAQAGIDATIPAAFLALLWPRLHDPTQRLIAALGAIVALVLVPLVAPGIPIIAAAFAVIVVRPWRRSEPAEEQR